MVLGLALLGDALQADKLVAQLVVYLGLYPGRLRGRYQPGVLLGGLEGELQFLALIVGLNFEDGLLLEGSVGARKGYWGCGLLEANYRGNCKQETGNELFAYVEVPAVGIVHRGRLFLPECLLVLTRFL